MAGEFVEQELTGDGRVIHVMEVGPVPNVKILTDIFLLNRMVRILLENVYSFTEEGVVRLSLEREGDQQLLLLISKKSNRPPRSSRCR